MGEEDSRRAEGVPMNAEKLELNQVGQEGSHNDAELPRWVYGGRGPSRETPAVSEKEARGYFLKRPFDAVVALIGLVIAAPLWIVFSLAIKLEDRGPVYFTQERWGRNKSKIRVYKFRSMVPNAVERFGNIQAQEHDPRVTRVGRLLRATSLDEMPQLLNIFKGDMSWVGPRALPIDEIQVREEERHLPDEAIAGFETRSRLRPGLTGIAQIFASRDVPRERKYRFDAVYAGSQSLRMDMRLILLSLWITVRARWEARESKL